MQFISHSKTEYVIVSVKLAKIVQKKTSFLFLNMGTILPVILPYSTVNSLNNSRQTNKKRNNIISLTITFNFHPANNSNWQQTIKRCITF